MDLGWLLFSFQGRLNRKPYWLTGIAIAVGLCVGVGLFFALFEAAPLLVSIVLIVAYIPVFWISLALGAKRLHDRDKSAAWLLVFYLLPSILGQIASRLVDSPAEEIVSLVLSGVASLIGLWAFIELGFLRGTSGPNRFGPDPLASSPTGLIGANSRGNEGHVRP